MKVCEEACSLKHFSFHFYSRHNLGLSHSFHVEAIPEFHFDMLLPEIEFKTSIWPTPQGQVLLRVPWIILHSSPLEIESFQLQSQLARMKNLPFVQKKEVVAKRGAVSTVPASAKSTDSFSSFQVPYLYMPCS